MDAVVIARAPVCVPLGGDMGGFAGSYERSGGPVICAATGYSVYALLEPSRLDGVHVTFAGTCILSGQPTGNERETGIQLDLLDSIVRRFGAFGHQNVFVTSQFPQVGIRLQGSLAVATLKAIAFRCGLDLEPYALAQLACDIGRATSDTNCPQYVHYAAALGGLCILARSSGKMVVEQIDLPPGVRQALEQRLMVFVALNRGRGHARAYPVAGDHRRAHETDEPDVEPIKGLVRTARSELGAGDLDAFGRLLHRLWVAGHGVGERDGLLRQSYDSALAAGALGGTALSGADGTCLILYCPPERQDDVTQKLTVYGFEQWPLALADEGVYALQGVPWSRSETGSPAAWLQPFAPSPPLFAREEPG
ncbi:MAG: hypothetical protein ACK2VA_17820 [Anaerolineae bacterium]|jgi:D-glycero-alpha-D-manno-heptose-7-phosphate kinase